MQAYKLFTKLNFNFQGCGLRGNTLWFYEQFYKKSNMNSYKHLLSVLYKNYKYFIMTIKNEMLRRLKLSTSEYITNTKLINNAYVKKKFVGYYDAKGGCLKDSDFTGGCINIGAGWYCV